MQQYTQQIETLTQKKEEASVLLKAVETSCKQAEIEFKEIESELQRRANSDIPLQVGQLEIL